MDNGNQPASPSDFTFTNQMGDTIHEMNPGLTKREAFAMAAMQGMIALLTDTGMDDQQSIDGTVEMSVRMADALLKELSNES